MRGSNVLLPKLNCSRWRASQCTQILYLSKGFEEVQHNGSSIAASILAGVAGADGLAVVHAPSRDMDRTNLCRHMLLVPRDVPEQRRLLNLGAVARCHHPVGAWSDCDLMVRDAAEVMGNLVAALTPPRPPVPAYDELSDAQSMLLALADNMAQVQTAMVRKGMHSPYDHIDVFESYVFAEQLGRDPAAFHVDLDEAQLLGLEKGEIELAPDFLLDARLAELLCNAISSRLADELDYKCEIAEAVAGTLDMDLADVLTVSDVIPRTLQLYGTVVPTSGDGNDLFYPDGSANPPVVAASLFERKKTAPQKLYELSNLRDALDLLLMLSDEEAEELCKAALGSPGNAIRKARALADKYVHIRNDAAREFLELFDAANEAVPVQVMAAAASVSLAFRGIVDPMVAQKMSNLLEKNETMGNPIFIALAGDTLRDKIVKEGQSYDGLTRMESQLGRVEADQLATMMLDVTVSNGDTIACRKPLNIPRPSLGNSDVWR